MHRYWCECRPGDAGRACRGKDTNGEKVRASNQLRGTDPIATDDTHFLGDPCPGTHDRFGGKDDRSAAIHHKGCLAKGGCLDSSRAAIGDVVDVSHDINRVVAFEVLPGTDGGAGRGGPDEIRCGIEGDIPIAEITRIGVIGECGDAGGLVEHCRRCARWRDAVSEAYKVGPGCRLGTSNGPEARTAVVSQDDLTIRRHGLEFVIHTAEVTIIHINTPRHVAEDVVGYINGAEPCEGVGILNRACKENHTATFQGLEGVVAEEKIDAPFRTPGVPLAEKNALVFVHHHVAFDQDGPRNRWQITETFKDDSLAVIERGNADEGIVPHDEVAAHGADLYIRMGLVAEGGILDNQVAGVGEDRPSCTVEDHVAEDDVVMDDIVCRGRTGGNDEHLTIIRRADVLLEGDVLDRHIARGDPDAHLGVES